jgi:hypothetical protein
VELTARDGNSREGGVEGHHQSLLEVHVDCVDKDMLDADAAGQPLVGVPLIVGQKGKDARHRLAHPSLSQHKDHL